MHSHTFTHTRTRDISYTRVIAERDFWRLPEKIMRCEFEKKNSCFENTRHSRVEKNNNKKADLKGLGGRLGRVYYVHTVQKCVCVPMLVCNIIAVIVVVIAI